MESVTIGAISIQCYSFPVVLPEHSGIPVTGTTQECISIKVIVHDNGASAVEAGLTYLVNWSLGWLINGEISSKV